MIDPEGRNLVFILSPPRAGSTLLAVMLGSHSQIFCPPEPWFLLSLSSIRGANLLVAPYDQVLAEQAFQELADETLFHQAARVFAVEIYNSKLAEAGKSIFVDKTPRYYHILPFLDSLFPQAKKVWLKRNPLDVVASCKTTWELDVDELMGKSLSPYSFDVTISWSLLMSYFEENSPVKAVIKYEDLVQDPESCMKSLCEFLGVPFERATLQYGDNQSLMSTYRRAVMGDKKVLEHCVPHTNSIARWRGLLTSEEVQEVLQTLGGGLFERLGYKEVVDEIGSEGGIVPDEGGRLEQLFEKYASFLRAHEMFEPDGRILGPSAYHTLFARQNVHLKGMLKQSEAERAARLEVIHEQGRRLGEVEAERNHLQAQLVDLHQQFETVEADLATCLESLKLQSEQLKQQGEQLQHLAAQNRNLNLQVSQLRSSWSWKITAPLREVGRILLKLKR